MNFLKKKLKAHKKAVEDDEDYGDYIPATPPHPSEVKASGDPAPAPFPTPEVKPKFVIPPKETKEEWQFFAQLSARVQQTVAATEAQLEKIKANTKVDEIEANTEKEYYFAEELEQLDKNFEEQFKSLSRSPSGQPKQSNIPSKVPTTRPLGPAIKPVGQVVESRGIKKPPGQWIDVEQESIDQEIIEKEPQSQPSPPPNEEDIKLKQILAEDFGFRRKSIEILDHVECPIDESELERIINYENDYLDDPFDTKSVEKRAQEELERKKQEKQKMEKPSSLDFAAEAGSGSKLRSVPCTPGEKIDADEIDIETTLKTGRLSRYASREDIAAARSLAQSRCNSVQSIHSLLTRKDSTNPFEEGAAVERRLSATSSPAELADPSLYIEEDQTVPNTIAALTEEFYKTISGLTSDLNEEQIQKAKEICEISPESDVERPLGFSDELQVPREMDFNQKTHLKERAQVSENELCQQSLPSSSITESENLIQEDADNLPLPPPPEEISQEHDIGTSHAQEETSAFDPFTTIVEDTDTPSRRSQASSATSGNEVASGTAVEGEEGRRDSVFSDSAENERKSSSGVYFDPFATVKEQSPSQPCSPHIEEINPPQEGFTYSPDADKNVGIVSPDMAADINDHAHQLVQKITEDAAVIAHDEYLYNIEEIEREEDTENLNLPEPTIQTPTEDENYNENYVTSTPPPPSPPVVEMELSSGPLDLIPEEDDYFPPPPTSDVLYEESFAPTANNEMDSLPTPPLMEDDDDPSYSVEIAKADYRETWEHKEVSPTPEHTTKINIDLPEDPFDTSVYELDSIKDRIPYANKQELDEFNRNFKDKGTSATSADPFASPLPSRKTPSDANVFDLFDPYAAPAPRNTPIAGRHPMPPTTMQFRRKKRHSRRSKRSNSSASASSGSEGSSSSWESSDSETGKKLQFVIRERVPDEYVNQEPATPLPPPPSTPHKSTHKTIRGVYDKPLLQVGRNRAKLAASRAAAGEDQKSPEEPELEVDPNLYANLRKQQEGERPDTPLFEESNEPFEPFDEPYSQLQWNFFVRHPVKKKITGNRFWKMIAVRFVPETATLQLCQAPNAGEAIGEPFQELPLQASYSVSEISAQQYDQFGKIFTLKLLYTFYREKAGAETGKKIAHNVKVMKGKLAHFTEKFNHMVNVDKVLDVHSKDSFLVGNALLQHTASNSELVKLASNDYDQLRQFKTAIEQCLFTLQCKRERPLAYRAEEIQAHVQDECWIKLNSRGHIVEQRARVRLFLLAFLNGPDSTCEIGLNDIRRQGNEIVGRYDIMPITTEQWIRVDNAEFHSSVDKDTFEEEQRLVRLVPPDACQFEFMRFRVRPPINRELPLLINAKMYLGQKKVELRIETMAAGAVSRKVNADIIPCEDICIRIAIPECWIYFFRTEKHLRFGSVKSANRRPGKIKGIERLLGATTNIQLETSMLEVSAGQAKYEHHHRALVWRIPRLPKEGQGAYKPQIMVLKLPLTSFDQMPESFYEFVHVEFNMPATTVSHAVIRSISVSNCDNPPEKYANYVSRYEYLVDLSIIHADDDNPYNLALGPRQPKPVIEEKQEEAKLSDDSDNIYLDDEDYDEEEEEEEQNIKPVRPEVPPQPQLSTQPPKPQPPKS